MRLDVIGFGALNVDELWEVPTSFLECHLLVPGQEYIRDADWFFEVYPQLKEEGILKGVEPGGSAANMVAALRKMGFETGFFGSAGREDSQPLRLHDLGDPGHLKISFTDWPSGRCLALIDQDDPQRDRCLVILPNANDEAGSAGLDMDYFSTARWVHFTSFVSDKPLEFQISLAENLPMSTNLSFDPGAIHCSRGASRLEPLLRRTVVLFVSEEEARMLCPNVPNPVSDLLDMGVKTIVMKRGSEGLTAYERGKEAVQPAVPPSRIIDRTGAGDVAAAGFLAGKIKGLTLEASLELAAAAASKSIEGYGRSAYPDGLFFDTLVSNH